VEGRIVTKVKKHPPRYADMNRDYPKRKDAAGYWLCRWCGCRLIGRRSSFCGTQCRDEVRIRCGFGVRSMVRRRDKGVCKKCGRDTAALRRKLNKIRRGEGHAAFIALAESEGVPKDRLYKTLWEADHVKPVNNGGGQCGIEGFQTLCIWCHRKKSAKKA